MSCPDVGISLWLLYGACVVCMLVGYILGAVFSQEH